jgi:ParB family chromosome partitioning protein
VTFAEAAAVAGRVLLVPRSRIHEDDGNPRKTFDEASVRELADSIAAGGLHQPVTLRLRPAGGYWLVLGARRLRACALLGWERVPAIVRDGMTDDEAATARLVENLQRVDVPPAQEGRAFAALLAPPHHRTAQQVADAVGKSATYVRTRAALADLAEPYAAAADAGTLSVAAALHLAASRPSSKRRCAGGCSSAGGKAARTASSCARPRPSPRK